PLSWRMGSRRRCRSSSLASLAVRWLTESAGFFSARSCCRSPGRSWWPGCRATISRGHNGLEIKVAHANDDRLDKRQIIPLRSWPGKVELGGRDSGFPAVRCPMRVHSNYAPHLCVAQGMALARCTLSRTENSISARDVELSTSRWHL